MSRHFCSGRKSLLQPDFLINPFRTESPVFARHWSRRTLSIAACCVLVVVIFAAVALHSRPAEIAEVPFSDLLRHVARGEVTEVTVQDDTLEFTLAVGPTLKTLMPANYLTANSAFVPELARNNIRIN